jgi:hypothetical protein
MTRHGSVEKLSPIIFDALAVVLGGFSLLFIVEWRKMDSRVVSRFRPSEGFYAAPAASAAGAQWATFASFWFFLAIPLVQFDVRALIAFASIFAGFLCGGMGVVVWLFMPDCWLVPKALRGSPGYLEVRGLYDAP